MTFSTSSHYSLYSENDCQFKKWIREHKEDYRGNRTGDFQDLYMDKIKAGDDRSDTSMATALNVCVWGGA